MLEKFVFTPSGKVMADNGKEESKLPELLSVMRTYGTVEAYDVNMTAVKAEFTAEYNDLKARYEAIKNLNLAPDEITLLNLYRDLKAKQAAVHVAEKEALKKQLTDIKAENDGRNAKILALLASASEAVK